MSGYVLYASPSGGGFQEPGKRLAADYGLGYKVVDMVSEKQTGKQSAWVRMVGLAKDAKFILIWNGMQHRGGLFTELAKSYGIPHAYLEYGMLSQDKSLFVDPDGFNGRSRLCKELSWVTNEDLEHLRRTREDLQRRHPIGDDGYVLITLQIEKDTQILYNSRYRTMKEFVRYITQFFKGSRVVVRPHPTGGADLDPGDFEVSREGNFLDVAARATAVVGLTSTCLFEAGVLGKPVLALGDHPLAAHAPRDHERVLAGALALRIPRAQPRIAPIFERFGIRPIGCNPLGRSQC